MPRTKQVRKKSSMINKRKIGSARFETVSSNENDELAALLSRDYESKDEFKAEYEKYYNKKLEMYNKSYELALEKIIKGMDDLKNNFPESLKNKTLQEEVSEDFESGAQDSSYVISAPKVRPSRSRTPDETFKKPMPPRGRASSRKRSLSASSASSKRTNDGFKTPLMSNRKLLPNSVITPKVYSDTPISVLRRPMQGEVAVSMSGSPLMVESISNEDYPTANVRLRDGRVYYILPDPDAPPDLQGIDETTKMYLKTLSNHLAILASDP